MRVWVQLAGGRGSRFGGKVPKQFQRLGKKPLLLHAIETFLKAYPNSPVIVVLPLLHFRYGEKLVRSAFPGASIYLTVGGDTRSASTEAALTLLQALELLQPAHVIAFHDAARPFVSETLIKRVFDEAEKSGATVCGLPVSVSLRKVEGTHSRALPRGDIWEIQTPQAFRGDVLLSAWHKLSPTVSETFTDEGSWIEAAGFPVSIVAGEPHNIKITYPFDWEVARAWVRRSKQTT